MADYKSPYVASLSPEIIAKTVAKDFLKEENYEPDEKVLAAIHKYRELQITPSMLLLVAALYRTLSTLLYGAPFVMSAIVVEVSVGLFLIFAGSRIETKD